MKRKMIIRRMLCLVLAVMLCLCTAGMSAAAKSKKSKEPSVFTAVAPDGSTRTYKEYRQTKNYKNGKFSKVGAKLGCVVTAVSIAASGFGINIPPQYIQDADATVPYGERYALAQLNLAHHKRQAYTPYLAAQILNNMGINTRYVPVFAVDAAEQEITAHLMAGKPVIIMAMKNTWEKIKIAHWRHAIVLVQLNADGTVTYINPNAKVNCTAATARHVKRKDIHLTVRQLLEHFMYSSTGNWAKAYNPSNCGGYILVG